MPELAEVALEDAMVVSTDTLENPCQEFSNIILVPKSSLNQGIITLNSSGATGNISSFKKIEADGKTWVCAGQN